MNGIRMLLGLVTTLALAVFAIPSIAAKPPQAPDKSYSIEFLLPLTLPQTDLNGVVNPSYGSDGQLHSAPTVIVYIKNVSPPSTAASNIGSLAFTVSSSLVIVSQPVCPNAICSADPLTGTITVTNISPPIQAQQAYPVTFKVNSCVVAGEAIVGGVQVSTGSQLTNGQPFSLFSGDPKFAPAPKLSTREPFDNFTTALTPVVTGISCGTAACPNPLVQSILVPNFGSDANSHPSSVVTLVRGLNADGSCDTSTGLPYFLTNKLAQPDLSAHTTWPRNSASPQVFAYQLTRDPNTGSDWHIGWLLQSDGSVAGLDPTITPSIACQGALSTTTTPQITDLPLPSALGTLTSDLRTNQTKIKVDTTPVFTGNFPIMIDTEWMLVTGISNNGWNVTRPFAASFQLHPAGSKVVTTPFKQMGSDVSSPYQVGQIAQMCVAWTAPDFSSIWIIDGSDGWGLSR